MTRDELVERLRGKTKVLPTQGGATLSFGGETSHYILDDGMRYINPDGPEAADRIEALEAENARLREALAPFAKITFEGTFWERHPDSPVLFIHATGEEVTVADFDKARTALTNGGDGDG